MATIISLTSNGTLEANSLMADTTVSADCGNLVLERGDMDTELETTYGVAGLLNTVQCPLVLCNQGAANDANAIACASVLKVSSPYINTDVVLHSFAWRGSDGVVHEGIRVKPNAIRFIGVWDVNYLPTGQQGDLLYTTNGIAGNPGFVFHTGSGWRRVNDPTLAPSGS